MMKCTGDKFRRHVWAAGRLFLNPTQSTIGIYMYLILDRFYSIDGCKNQRTQGRADRRIDGRTDRQTDR